MIIAAALCPWPPLLVRELTGADPVISELRQACATAVTALLRGGPDLVAVVGPGPDTREWPASSRLNVAAFGGLPTAGRAGPVTAEREPGGPGRPIDAKLLPSGVGLGAYLLDQADYQGPRALWSVSQQEPVMGCAALGRSLAGAGGRTALLVMGDGSARRGPRAPGHFDERAAGFDAEVLRAIRAGDLDALLALDPGLARELMATGRPAWQVLAGALAKTPGRAALVTDVLYADDPFGVAYLVATLHQSDQLL